MDPVAIVYHEEVVGYDFGRGHPFRGDRFSKFMTLVDEKGLLVDPYVSVVKPEPASDHDLSLVHPERYIMEVKRRERLSLQLSLDTPLKPGLVEAAKIIVGSSLKAGKLVAENAVKIAEGVGGGLHHAGKTYGGGFCIFNDVAVCAQSLLENHNLNRLMILDSDVHAGNGTMDIFYKEPRVLFVSVHQDPYTLYPGTGFIEQIGEGEGKGYTVNVPMPPGSDDQCMKLFLNDVFKPIADDFKPQIIIRNGGSDPHFMDSLGGFNLTYNGLRSIGEAVAEAANRSKCGVVDLCCSGYNPSTIAEGWLSILAGVMERKMVLEDPLTPPISSEKIYVATKKIIKSVRKKLGAYWNL
jgi:acetoin utilization protein AcuC